MSCFEKTNHAEICPVCKGSGIITKHYAPANCSYTCHGCKGQGWVIIEDIQYTVSEG